MYYSPFIFIIITLQIIIIIIKLNVTQIVNLAHTNQLGKLPGNIIESCIIQYNNEIKHLALYLLQVDFPHQHPTVLAAGRENILPII